MFRILFFILMVAQVAACPYNCAASAADSQTSVEQAKQECSCCQSPASQESSSPTDGEKPDGCCICFCDGAVNAVSPTTFSVDLRAIWIDIVDSRTTLSRASAAMVIRSLRPPGDGSGRAVRLVYQSLLL